MTRRIRLGEFPGGVLEINAYDDDPTDGQPGVYLESRHADHSAQRGAEIQYRPAAIGHLRTDVSGIARFHDESQIRTLATRLGYDFADMIVYDPKFGRPPLARPTPATKAPASASTPRSNAHRTPLSQSITAPTTACCAGSAPSANADSPCSPSAGASCSTSPHPAAHHRQPRTHRRHSQSRTGNHTSRESAAEMKVAGITSKQNRFTWALKIDIILAARLDPLGSIHQ